MNLYTSEVKRRTRIIQANIIKSSNLANKNNFLFVPARGLYDIRDIVNPCQIEKSKIFGITCTPEDAKAARNAGIKTIELMIHQFNEADFKHKFNIAIMDFMLKYAGSNYQALVDFAGTYLEFPAFLSATFIGGRCKADLWKKEIIKHQKQLIQPTVLLKSPTEKILPIQLDYNYGAQAAMLNLAAKLNRKAELKCALVYVGNKDIVRMHVIGVMLT